MNLSRWCLTASFALGALACSDPVPPPAQGAVYTEMGMTTIPSKSCSAGTAFTYDVPAVLKDHPTEVLDKNTYLHKIVDGESNAQVRCSVSGSSTFTFSGRIIQNSAGIELANGMLGADHKGTARVTITNAQQLSSSLISPMNCTIDASTQAGASYQVKGGSMWATFDCVSVEAPPADACFARGTFVLENCEQ